jgi:putative nucleotidyltransferase with HDIG domain
MAPPTILVVDDDVSVRTIVSAMLEPAGYEPVLAGSAEEAIRRLTDGLEPRLILSDIVMTGMTGLALLDHVRGRHPEIPIVMVSGVSDLAVAIGTLRNGAYDYLLKPFERDQLLSTVMRALEYRALVEQNNMYRSHLEELVAARTEMLNSAIGDLERSYDITLEALGDALDLKDTETEGHSRRVTAYTIALARAMQLPPQEIRTIARGAFLHDVGKMAIPDAILLKPGRLTRDEQTTMREHCARGYQMLRKIPYLREAAEIVYSHQEHFNGSGYPRGLKGEEIPLGARIFAVADVLDAITSDRPYRNGTSFATARREIKKNIGTQFDPDVVNVFLQMPERVWEDLRAEIQGEAQRFNPFSLGAVKHLLPRKETSGAKNGILKTMPETSKKSGALDSDALKAAVAKLPGWKVEAGVLTRTFSFPNFVEGLAFVQSLGVEAEHMQHHPDLDIRYSKVRVALVTHDAGGITAKDITMAQRADNLATPLNGK